MVFPPSLCLATVVLMAARNVVTVKEEVRVLPVADDFFCTKNGDRSKKITCLFFPAMFG